MLKEMPIVKIKKKREKRINQRGIEREARYQYYHANCLNHVRRNPRLVITSCTNNKQPVFLPWLPSAKFLFWRGSLWDMYFCVKVSYINIVIACREVI